MQNNFTPMTGTQYGTPVNPYQSYSAPTAYPTNSYTNPNNNYISQYPNQNPSQQPALPALSGRTISTLQDIRPNEIAMDGSVSYFPASDGSCIYAKSWSSDGTIQTVKFVPERPIAQPQTNHTQAVQATQQTQPDLQQIMEKLDSITKLIKRNNTWKNNKEGSNNEQ